jgi:hypothetical protein
MNDLKLFVAITKVDAAQRLVTALSPPRSGTYPARCATTPPSRSTRNGRMALPAPRTANRSAICAPCTAPSPPASSSRSRSTTRPSRWNLRQGGRRREWRNVEEGCRRQPEPRRLRRHAVGERRGHDRASGSVPPLLPITALIGSNPDVEGPAQTSMSLLGGICCKTRLRRWIASVALTPMRAAVAHLGADHASAGTAADGYPQSGDEVGGYLFDLALSFRRPKKTYQQIYQQDRHPLRCGE